MKHTLRDQSGAALLTILLFVVIMLILVTTMLTVAGNETIISGLHRDSVRAKEIAEGGLSEALRRIAQGHDYALKTAEECYKVDPNFGGPGFNNSLMSDGSAKVRVCPQIAGAGGAILEIQSNATVGLARRRLSLIVAQQLQQFLPNIVYGHNCSGNGNVKILSGDIYCQTYLSHKVPESALQLSYGGWYIEKKPKEGPDPAFGPCYRRDQIVDGVKCEVKYPNWWPGHRRSMYKDTPINVQLGQGNDARKLSLVFNFTCPAGLTGDQPLSQIDSLKSHGRADDTVSTSPDLPSGMYQSGDMKQNNTGMLSSEPLYGCTEDGFPYTWVREAFDHDADPKTPDATAWFKTIEFERWRDNYFVFCLAKGNPSVPECASVDGPTLVKSQILVDEPWRGAVPPFPDFDSLDDNYSTKVCRVNGVGCDVVSSSGTLTGADPINWGCKSPDMSCPGGKSDPRTILLTGGNYKINANLQAHGTILVGPNANLEVSGTFTCWCTLIVDGDLTRATGTVTVYGGLVAKNTIGENGTITVYAGGSVASVPVGSSQVDTISWWQR